MSQFRAKRLDLGGYINSRIIRDHTKRKVYEQYEPERYVFHFAAEDYIPACLYYQYTLKTLDWI